MNILVLGATGGTGHHIVTQALAAGHHVTAVARVPVALAIRHPALQVVHADVWNAASLIPHAVGQDAVVSAIGVRGFVSSLRPTRLYSQTAQVVVQAMHLHGVQRVIGVSSAGVVADPTQPHTYRYLIRPLLRHVYADMRRMETIIGASDLAWTIVRAGALTHGPRTDRYRVGTTHGPPHGTWISRADLAAFILHVLATDAYTKRTPALAY